MRQNVILLFLMVTLVGLVVACRSGQPDTSNTVQLVNTVTPSLTPTSVAATGEVVIHQGDANHLPAIGQSLLFLANTTLLVWNHQTNKIESLMGPDIYAFSMSVDRQRFVAAQRVKDTPLVYDLVLWDFTSGVQSVLVNDLNCLLDFELSPDGQTLAYIADEWDFDNQLCVTRAVANEEGFSTSNGLPRGGIIYVMPTYSPLMPPSEIGYCEGFVEGITDFEGEYGTYYFCAGLNWTRDSEHLIWFDALAIWRYDVAAAAVTMLRPLFKNGEDQLYTSLDWSPQGKYFISTGRSLSGSGNKHLLVNWQTGQTVETPHANCFFIGPCPERLWLNDSQLLFLITPGVIERWALSADQLSLNQTNSIRLVQENAQYLTTSPFQMLDGRIAFALLAIGDQQIQRSGLFAFDLTDQSIEMIVALPPIYSYADTVDISWSTDNRDLIIEYRNNSDEPDVRKYTIYYLSMEKQQLYDMTDVLGESARYWFWLP